MKTLEEKLKEIIIKWFPGGYIFGAPLMDGTAGNIIWNDLQYHVFIAAVPTWVSIKDYHKFKPTTRKSISKIVGLPDMIAYVYKDTCKEMPWALWWNLSQDNISRYRPNETYLHQNNPAWQIRKSHE